MAKKIVRKKDKLHYIVCLRHGKMKLEQQMVQVICIEIVLISDVVWK